MKLTVVPKNLQDIEMSTAKLVLEFVESYFLETQVPGSLLVPPPVGLQITFVGDEECLP